MSNVYLEFQASSRPIEIFKNFLRVKEAARVRVNSQSGPHVKSQRV